MGTPASYRNGSPVGDLAELALSMTNVGIMQQPIVYASVDAAVEDLVKELPLIQHIKFEMEQSGAAKTDVERYQLVCSVIEMLKHSGVLQRRLETLKNPYGSVLFSFVACGVGRGERLLVSFAGFKIDVTRKEGGENDPRSAFGIPR